MSHFENLVAMVEACGGHTEVVCGYVLVSADLRRSEAGKVLEACIGMFAFKGKWAPDAVDKNEGKQMFGAPDAIESRGGGLSVAVMEEATAIALLLSVQKAYAEQNSGWIAEGIEVVQIDHALVQDWVGNPDNWTYSPSNDEVMGGLM